MNDDIVESVYRPTPYQLRSSLLRPTVGWFRCECWDCTQPTRWQRIVDDVGAVGDGYVTPPSCGR